MSHRTFVRFRLISIILFVLGLVSVAVALSYHQANSSNLRHRKGFTLTTRDSAVPINPPPDSPKIIKYSVSVRYQKSDGTWKEVRKYFNSKDELVKKDIGMGIPGQGVYRLNMATHELEFLSSMPPKEKTSFIKISDGSDQPNFVRNEVVHGYETYVLRFPEDDGGYREIYYAPDLDGAAIKHVSVSPLGVGVEEIVGVKLGEPDERAFNGLPNWLVNYDHFKQKIATLEEAGKHETAEALRKELAAQIAKQEKEQ